MARPRILLWNCEKLCLIVPCPSGVIYQNQVGGNVCWQAEMEGVLAPLDDFDNALAQLEGYDFPTGGQGISVATADFVDRILASSRTNRFLSVDRTRLGECWEAWIHVRIAPVPSWTWPPGPPKDADYLGPIFGFTETSGILTWPNSD